MYNAEYPPIMAATASMLLAAFALHISHNFILIRGDKDIQQANLYSSVGLKSKHRQWLKFHILAMAPCHSVRSIQTQLDQGTAVQKDPQATQSADPNESPVSARTHN